MRHNPSISHSFERGAGHIGLFLMVVIATLANRGFGEDESGRDRLTGFLARRGIDVIAAVGWVADRIPGPAAPSQVLVR